MRLFLTKNSKPREYELLEKIQKTYNVKLMTIGDSDIKGYVSAKIPSYNSNFMTILALIKTLQLLSFKLALRLGLDVDKPTGLNKVVEDRK